MTSFQHKPLAKSVEFDEDTICVELLDGRKIVIPLVYFPRLLQANDKDRQDYIISGGGVGLHWEAIDEDIHVENLLFGIFDSDGRFFKTA